MMYFLCVSSCRSGVPLFFRRAGEKIKVLKVMKTGKNWEKLGKTGENWGKLVKIAEIQFLRIFASFHEFW